MRIIRRRHYLNSLKNILIYIAEDKQGAAQNFKTDLDSKLEQLLDFPKMYKQSIYHDDENYHDMVFKGYTVIYKVYPEHIEILDIFKWVDKEPLD